MKSLFWILLVGIVAYALGDVKSTGLIDGFLFPFIFALSVLALVVWIVIRFSVHPGNKDRWSDPGSGDGFGAGFFDGDGGDGGGCGGD
ncbi:MAG: hypothetical protein CVV16_04825 [Gammaproteobacteria bacterium HGW-Gammaproteobacteria-6]|nr:MAG: hypothetical protein CVV16_04825 [Gammaproteobacteria bacterium HGW-Gammaproteobacteria-6]